MKQLSKRQQEALQAIAEIWRQGRAPRTGELLEALRLATESGLTDLLRYLEAKGFITITSHGRGSQRLIELTSQGRMQSGFGFPIVGEITAGPLQEAIQQSGEWIEGAGSVLDLRPKDFFLRVKGDSMIGAGIITGDLVQLRPQIEYRSGEIVAAQICESEGAIVESTLKYIERLEGGAKVRLRAANPAYPDREFPAQCVTVAGVYRGLIRGGIN